MRARALPAGAGQPILNLMPSITTFFFDWGGVLIDDPAPGLVAVMSEHLGVSGEAFGAALHRQGEPWTKGTCSESEFWRAMCGDLGVGLPRMPSLWGQAFRTVYRRKEEVWDLARRLRRSGYKVGLLSNTESCAVEYFHATQPDIFDARVFSCCEGCRKPEAAIYHRALEKLGARAEETVFIDDNEPYVQGAAAVGIRAIQFRDYGTLMRDLGAMGIMIGS